MADLTSKEWRDLIFEGKNKDFGAYQIRKNSDKRHNLAVLWTLIGLVIVALGIWAWVGVSDYLEQKALEQALEAEKMSQVEIEAQPEAEEPEDTKYEEEKKPEVVQEEVAATVQQTQIAIVPPNEVKNAVQDVQEQQENTTTVGIVNQEGSDDVDRHQVVATQVKVEPVPVIEEKPKPKDEPEKVFEAVEQQAQFKGNVNKWLASHLNYPVSAQENGIEGKVPIRFIVEKDGSISDVKVLKSVDRDLDKEAVRVVKSMPKWQPGKNNGIPVRSYFTVTINFRLGN